MSTYRVVDNDDNESTYEDESPAKAGEAYVAEHFTGEEEVELSVFDESGQEWVVYVEVEYEPTYWSVARKVKK